LESVIVFMCGAFPQDPPGPAGPAARYLYFAAVYLAKSGTYNKWSLGGKGIQWI